MTPLSLLAAGLGATALWLGWSTLQATKTRKAARAGYFDAVAPSFDRLTTRIEPTGFPRLTAHLGKDAFDLQALPDSLTFRKLPALWVMVTLPAPLPVAVKVTDARTSPATVAPSIELSNSVVGVASIRMRGSSFGRSFLPGQVSGVQGTSAAGQGVSRGVKVGRVELKGLHRAQAGILG